jgi:rhodanese-related sulfurtransferase
MTGLLAVLPLLSVVRDHAADPDLLDLLDHHPDERSWIRLLTTDDYELWLISWPVGAATDWHDHGPSAGAFTVLRGSLTEHTFDGGTACSTPSRSSRSPRKRKRVMVGGVVTALSDTVVGMQRFDGVDALLADARSRLERLTPRAAFDELTGLDAVIVDIRPAAQRAASGEVGGGIPVLVIERNVLEWRFDPRSEARIPEASYDRRVIVLCQEGYSSSLAADALQSLGIHRATDVIGGFDAWRAAGLPVV